MASLVPIPTTRVSDAARPPAAAGAIAGRPARHLPPAEPGQHRPADHAAQRGRPGRPAGDHAAAAARAQGRSFAPTSTRASRFCAATDVALERRRRAAGRHPRRAPSASPARPATDPNATRSLAEVDRAIDAPARRSATRSSAAGTCSPGRRPTSSPTRSTAATSSTPATTKLIDNFSDLDVLFAHQRRGRSTCSAAFRARCWAASTSTRSSAADTLLSSLRGGRGISPKAPCRFPTARTRSSSTSAAPSPSATSCG